ncbi:tRNA (uridine(34)/cytosine(34)/5-carboxymethylaminomethyluridine(34)-2'-O)-methyltransferase TrmL [Desulfuribacillus stibiiarsenatis]|uniref:Putative tRNA (cytidine(34)-2'-O)-methyltransferase n=1 Tax=Desulfuribacillus stibiiarsenatis TaxID=1390249 RepID=A0A1E5L987_9FIRM|nr:tRNA (uridine(34)/cytosine(34)/5-carboxymethylaminomethyluridine(34)-2'-O)-methyltransferase TrmL [Desulfuribacillus stibiiarsenatis]
MEIVLVEPEIPQNTGNIVRTCAATNIKLHLVHPMGFSIDEKQVKRAGLDYWHLVEIEEHLSLQAFMEKYEGQRRMFYSTTKAKDHYAQVEYQAGDMILFGKETKGLPEEFIFQNPERNIRIPMGEESRSLNLSNAVAIVTYEALRQMNFEGLR